MSEVPDRFAKGAEQRRVGGFFSLLAPPEELSYIEWIRKYRILSSEASDKSGKFDPYYTPYFIAMYEVFSVPYQKHEGVWMKPAQFGFTEAENNIVGKVIHQREGSIIVGFPREASAKSYKLEKFRPLVSSTPALARIFKGPYAIERQAWNQPRFPGGSIKFITAASPSAMKSSSAPVVIQEEPDDVKDDVQGQGNGIDVLSQRLKTYRYSILLFGGTPVRAGKSQVEDAYNNSKRGRYVVPCHECGKSEELDFDNLKCPENPKMDRPFTGTYVWEESYYECPHCEAHWDFDQKNVNVREAEKHNHHGWVYDDPDNKTWGWRGSELMSPFPGSSFAALKKQELEAAYHAERGKEGKLISFTNNSKGLPYSPKGELGDEEAVKTMNSRAYREGTVKEGMLALTAGIDVQKNRLAISVRSWGRNGNSALVLYTEIFGRVDNKDDPCWKVMETLLSKKYPYELSTAEMPFNLSISHAGMDSGDGTRSALVYQFVSAMRAKGIPLVATKGYNEQGTLHEVYNLPSDSSKSYLDSVASRYGVYVYMIGTNKAKAEIYRRLMLDGEQDRFLAFSTVIDSYWTQLISNVPRKKGNYTTYELVGPNDESLDCEVMAFHSAFAIQLPYWSDETWDALEASYITALSAPKQTKKAESSFGGY